MLDSLKKIGGMFVEMENKPSQSANPEPKNNISSVPGFSVPGVSSRPVGIEVAISQEQDEKFKQHFQKLLEDRNLPGPDFLEFHKLLEQFASLPMDEVAKFKTAFTSLLVMGITKEKLIESAKHYLNVLENDRKIFLSSVSEKQNQDVTGRDTEIANLKIEIQKNSEMIVELNKKNSEAIAKMEILEQEKTKAEDSIRIKQQSYLTHSDGMIAKIDSDIQKIQSNI